MYNYYETQSGNRNPYIAWNAAVEAEIENPVEYGNYEFAVTGVPCYDYGCANTYPQYNYIEPPHREEFVYTGFDLDRWNNAIENEFGYNYSTEEEYGADYPFANTVQQQYVAPQPQVYQPPQYYPYQAPAYQPQPQMYQGNGYYPYAQPMYPPQGAPGNYYGEMTQRRYGIDDSTMTAAQIEQCRAFMDTFEDPYAQRWTQIRREANNARNMQANGIEPGSRTMNRPTYNNIPYVPVEEPQPTPEPVEEVKVDNNGAVIVGRDKPCPYTDIITNRPLTWEEYDSLDLKHKKAVYDKYSADCRDKRMHLTKERKEQINEAMDRDLQRRDDLDPFKNAHDVEDDYLAYQDAYVYPESCPIPTPPEKTITPDLVQDFDNATLALFPEYARETYLTYQMEAEGGDIEAINKFRQMKIRMDTTAQHLRMKQEKERMEAMYNNGLSSAPAVEEKEDRNLRFVDGLPFGLGFCPDLTEDEEEPTSDEANNLPPFRGNESAADMARDMMTPKTDHMVSLLNQINDAATASQRQFALDLDRRMREKLDSMNPMMQQPPRNLNQQGFVRNIQEVPYQDNRVYMGVNPPPQPGYGYPQPPIPSISSLMGTRPAPMRHLPGFGNSYAPAPIDIVHMDKEMLMENAFYYDREAYLKQERDRAENERKAKEDEVAIWKKMVRASYVGTGQEITPEVEEYLENVGKEYIDPTPAPEPDEYDIVAYTGRLLNLTAKVVDGVNVLSPSMEPIRQQYRAIQQREKRYHPDDVGFVEWCNEYAPMCIFEHEMEEVSRQRVAAKRKPLIGHESVIENFARGENERLFWYIEDLEQMGYEVYIEDGMLKFSDYTKARVNDKGETIIEVRDPVPVIDILTGKAKNDFNPNIIDPDMLWEEGDPDRGVLDDDNLEIEYNQRLATLHERRARVQ